MEPKGDQREVLGKISQGMMLQDLRTDKKHSR